jgi:hypothetical protein
MKLTKIIEKLYNNQLETTKQVDAIQAHANNLKGLNLARLKLIDKLDKIEAEPSGNIEQLKEVVQELESDHTCTHPHSCYLPPAPTLVNYRDYSAGRH